MPQAIDFASIKPKSYPDQVGPGYASVSSFLSRSKSRDDFIDRLAFLFSTHPLTAIIEGTAHYFVGPQKHILPYDKFSSLPLFLKVDPKKLWGFSVEELTRAVISFTEGKTNPQYPASLERLPLLRATLVEWQSNTVADWARITALHPDDFAIQLWEEAAQNILPRWLELESFRTFCQNNPDWITTSIANLSLSPLEGATEAMHWEFNTAGSLVFRDEDHLFNVIREQYEFLPFKPSDVLSLFSEETIIAQCQADPARMALYFDTIDAIPDVVRVPVLLAAKETRILIWLRTSPPNVATWSAATRAALMANGPQVLRHFLFRTLPKSEAQNVSQQR